MSGPPERSFSFNYHDESTLQPRGHGYQQQHHQSYQDESAVSPIEPPHAQHISSSYGAPPPPPAHQSLPSGMHPGSAYNQMQTQRQYGGQQESLPRMNTIPRRPISQSPPPSYGGAAIPNSSQPRRLSDTTPGMDNLGETAAGGGIAGIAIGVANTNERDSGVQALRDIDNLYRPNDMTAPRNTPLERRFDQEDDSSYGHYSQTAVPPRRPVNPQPSYSSTVPLAAVSSAPAAAARAESSSERSLTLNERPSPNPYPYTDSPYEQYSSSNLRLAPAMGAIDPNSIADDDDDFAQTHSGPKRRSILPFGNNRNSSREGITPAAAGVGAGTAAGGAFTFGARDSSGTYNPVPTHGAHDSVGGGIGGGSIGPSVEKSDWLNRQNSGNKRLKWIVGTIVAIVIIGAIVGGVIGGVLSHKNNKSSSNDGGGKSSPESVANDNKSDLDKDSDEIKKLMGNPNLHKVFPGMDYTPLNAQYPDCMNSPPSQNNVTRDMAVLSQLTNAVRLYGTDCNQTEMVLHAIDRLDLTDMKVWLGVWLGNNQTTNDRQLAQMWKILDDNKGKTDIFKGVIVGNEVLFREDLTIVELGKILADVKKNLTDQNIDLPLATSDLGDNWTAALTKDVDIVMSNIHPFFAGVTAEVAAGWTWTFWQGKDVVLTQGTTTKQIISEVGWPSAGGNDCGQSDCTTKTEGSIAGIDEMNTFMDSWVCQSLANGTEYFWFEAFDEPWKVQFNTPGKEWEDKWGLMDIDRNLKDGVKIPDCGGKTAS